MDLDFVVILEDDTWLDASPAEIASLSPVTSLRPTLTVLATNPRFTLRARLPSRRDLPPTSRLAGVPTSTRAYVLNRPAMKALASENSNRGVEYLADFAPRYFDLVEFWIANSSLVHDLPVPSVIDARPNTSSRFDTAKCMLPLAPILWMFAGYRYCRLSGYLALVYGRPLASALSRFKRSPG
jgi:hypothetical protein